MNAQTVPDDKYKWVYDPINNEAIKVHVYSEYCPICKKWARNRRKRIRELKHNAICNECFAKYNQDIALINKITPHRAHNAGSFAGEADTTPKLPEGMADTLGILNALDTAITVAELIEQLSKLDKNTKVIFKCEYEETNLDYRTTENFVEYTPFTISETEISCEQAATKKVYVFNNELFSNR